MASSEARLQRNNEQIGLLVSDEEKKRRTYPGLGLIVGALSGIVYATISLFARLLTGKATAPLIAWVRGIEALFLLLPFLAKSKFKMLFGTSSKDKVLLVLLIFINTAILTMAILCFQRIPLGDGATLIACSFIYVAILSSIQNCRLCNPLDFIVMISCIIGTVLCVQPTFLFRFNEVEHNFDYYMGFLFAFLVSFLFACNILVVEQLNHIPVVIKILYTTAGPCLPMTFYLAVTNSFVFPSGLLNYCYLFSFGFTSLLANQLVILGTHLDHPLMVSIGRTTDIPMCFIYDLLIFGEHLKMLSAIGASIVVVSITIPAIIKLKSNIDD